MINLFSRKTWGGNIEIKEMLLDSIKYPSKDWIKVIVLGFISLFSLTGIAAGFNPLLLLLLILGFIPIGYLFRIIKITFEGSDELPEFDQWREMFFDGFKVVLVAIIYAIPLIIIFIIPFIDQTSSINASIISIQTLWGIFISNVQIIVFIIISLVEILGIANMALYDGNLQAAFNFREIFKRISMIGWRKYVVCYVLIWISGLLAVLISFLAFTITIGIIVVPLLIVPYFAILATRFLALTFASSES